jgi:hypothetical protein
MELLLGLQMGLGFSRIVVQGQMVIGTNMDMSDTQAQELEKAKDRALACFPSPQTIGSTNRASLRCYSPNFNRLDLTASK